MTRGYFVVATLITVLLFGVWGATWPDPIRSVENSLPGHPPSELVFATNYPSIKLGWNSPREIAQPDGSRDVVLHEEADWRLTRHWPSGNLNVANRQAGKDWTHIPIGLAWRRSQLPLLAFASADLKSFYILTYDVVTNIPSGRTLKPVREGLDMYRITLDSGEEPERIASALPLGGFDTRLFSRQSGDIIILCGGNRCLTINGKGEVQPWALDALADHEIIEVVFVNNTKAFALTRLRHDDRLQGPLSMRFATYYVYELLNSGAQVVTTLTENGVPWGLKTEGGVPVLRLAQNATDMRSLLQYEFSLMPFAGVMDYGANNLEGRLAWSAVYYLNSLISLSSWQTWLPLSDRQVLRERLTNELELIARLVQTKYPSYLSKRYSIDREPMLVALHVGRVLQLLARAKRYGITSQAILQATDKICETLTKLDATLEESKTISDDTTYLFYRKGFPFWADGANVPYNYVSGVIAGRLEAGCIGVNEARSYFQPILRNEFNLSALPQQWRYWWGQGDKGWTETDMISTNTLTYKGNGGSLAHISYRSMDVASLLLFGQVGGMLPAEFLRHVVSLIERGSLYPFLNETLSRQGQNAPLNDLAMHRFARAISPWELQNQVWALAFLASKTTKD